jgi:thiol-disulfide isomerase/thioredoxin
MSATGGKRREVSGSITETIRHLAPPAIGILVTLGVGLWHRRSGLRTAPMLAVVIVASLAVARMAFVFQHVDSYRADLLEVFDLADGGFSAMAGLFAAFVMGAEMTRKTAALRRPLVIASLTGITAWVATTVVTLDFSPAQTLVPLVEVRRLDGASVQLRTLTTKPMVVNLWATWCPPCRREMPVLREGQRRHPDVEFVFVNQGEDAGTIERYLAREGLNVDNVLIDPVNAVAQRTASYAYPTTLFFDDTGKLFMRHVGELNKASLEERLDMLSKAVRQR